MTTETSKKVFISYIHYDSGENYRPHALALAQRLQADGFDCVLDQYYEAQPPPQGWLQWMQAEVKAADYVLVVCTATYYHYFQWGEQPSRGKGIRWEGGILTEEFYEDRGRNTQYIPIGNLPSPHAKKFIPAPLRRSLYYDVSTEEGYTALLRRLTRQAEVMPAPPATVHKRAISPAPINQDVPVTHLNLIRLLKSASPSEVRQISSLMGAHNYLSSSSSVNEAVADLVTWAFNAKRERELYDTVKECLSDWSYATRSFL